MKEMRYVYKEKAAKNMVGKYSLVIPVIIIFGIITSGISTLTTSYRPKYEVDWNTFERTLVDPGNPSMVFLFGIFAFVVGAIIYYATTKMFIQTANDEMPVIEDILVVGLKDNPFRSIVLQFLIDLFVFLWALLFIIPGIVKSYAYSMSFYLAQRKPELAANEALDLSKKITKGYKMDLFILDLSYLGWYFIGLFTFGILWLWIVPKHMTARTLYFKEIYEISFPTPLIIDGEIID